MNTEANLYSRILEKLEFEPEIEATDIALGIDEGIVTVRGVVKSYAEKNAVERAINNVSGVQGVANELSVSIPELFQHSDADIAKAAANALFWNVNLPMDSVKVAVENGKLKLTGTVNWWFQRRSAEECVRNLAGIVNIHNNITIKPIVKAKDVKEKIVREFERSAEVDANRIQVATQEGKVTLSGTVRSWAEQNEAIRASWSVPGVNNVESQLRIQP